MVSQVGMLPYEAREVAMGIHRDAVAQAQALRVAAASAIESVTARAPPFGPPAARHPGRQGWEPAAPCAACGLPENPWGPSSATPASAGSTSPASASGRRSCRRRRRRRAPGARRPRATANEDWICPECEMRGARTNRWKLGPVPLDINVPPPSTPDAEDPVAVATRDVTRQLSQLSFPQLLLLTADLIRWSKKC